MAKPIAFKESNRTLIPDHAADYSDRVSAVCSLDVWTDGEQCVSRWKFSFWERVKVAITGKAWVAVLSGNTQPPICVTGDVSYFDTKR